MARPFEEAPPFEDPRFPTTSGGVIRPTTAGVRDVTAAAREAADVSSTLNQQMGALIPLVTQMQQGFAMSASSVEKMVSQLERIGGIQSQNNRHLQDETKLRDQANKHIESRRKAEEAIASAQGKGVSHTRELMRQYDMYDKRSRMYRVDGNKYNTMDLTTILSNPTHPDHQKVLRAVQNKMAGNMDEGVGSPSFKVGDLAGAAMRGDVGGIVKELTQRGKAGAAFERGTESLGFKMATGSSNRLISGLGTRLMGLAPLIGGLGTPAALIAGEQIYSRGMQQINEMRDFGMITGQSGIGAGTAARAHAIRAGLNPFDIVGTKDVMQAEMAAAQAGYRGGDANRVTDISVALRQDLGIPIKEASDLTVTAIRDAGMSFDQVRATMGELDDATKAAGTSIEQMTGAVKEAMTSLSQFGTAPAQAAPSTIAGITAQFANIPTLAKRPGLVNQFVTGDARRIIAQRTGFRLDQIYSPEFSKNFQIEFNKVLLDIAKARPRGMDWGQYVRLFMTAPDMQQLFGPTPYQAIEGMLKDVWKQSDEGAHPEELGREQRVTRAYTDTQAIQRQYARDAQKANASGRRFDTKGRRMGGIDQGMLRQSAERAIASMRDLAESYGLNPVQRQEILAPIRAAEASGGDVGEAIGQSRGILEDKVRSHVSVDFSPDMKKYIRSNTAWIEVQTGMRPAQGVQRWP